MRITYLHQYFNTPEMSGGTRSYEMARRLVAKGHEVNMITSWREPDGRWDWFVTEEAGIKVHWLPVPYSNHMGYGERIRAFLRFARGAARKAASLPADVVFATSTPLTIALPGVYASRRLKVPMVFEVRDLWPDVPIALGVLKYRWQIAATRWLERFAYQNSARVVALAPGMKEGVAATGYPIDRIDIIPNGCDLDSFNDTNNNIHSLCDQHPWISEGPLILYIGTLGKANGTQYIPCLASELEKADSELSVRFAIIGEGKEEENIRNISKKLDVLNKSVFFIGKIPKKIIPYWLKECTCTIMTYSGPEVLYRDSVSNKFFDSLAAGKPVIANFHGFSTVLAKNFDAGIILPSNNFKGAAQLMSQTLRDSRWMSIASTSAFTLGKKFFDRDSLAQELDKTLHAAVNGHESYNSTASGSEYERIWNEALGK